MTIDFSCIRSAQVLSTLNRFLVSILLLVTFGLGLQNQVHAQSNTGDAVVGKAAYIAANCALCHDGPPVTAWITTNTSLVFSGIDSTIITRGINNVSLMNKYKLGGTVPLTATDLKNMSAYICSERGLTTGVCQKPAPAVPLASVSPASYGFGNNVVVGSNASYAVALSNTGGSPLTVSSISFSGGSVANFSQTNNCTTAAIAGPSGSCSINVVFSPSATNAVTSNLVITHNNNNLPGSTSSVSLSGTGKAAATPQIATNSPVGGLTFSAGVVGKSAATQALSISNVGNANLALPANPFSISGTDTPDFKVTATSCATSLGFAAGANNCAVSVTYAPLTAGSNKSAALVIANSSGLPAISIALSGSATSPVPSLQVSGALAFGKQLTGSTTSLGIVLSSNGTGDVVFGSTAFASGSPAFNLSSTNCTGTLTIGSSCNATFTFAPLAVTGLFTSTLAVNSNARPATTIGMTGEAVAPAANLPKVNVGPGALTFAGQVINSTSSAQTLTVSNTGSATLNISAINLTGANTADFFITTGAGSCGNAISLAVGASCKLYVTYKPVAMGSSIAQLSITSDSVGSTAAGTSLSGAGLDTPKPIASLAGANLYLFTGLNGSQNFQTITLVNTGNADLTGNYNVAGGDFAATLLGTCSPSLLVPASQSCTVVMKYAPIAAGKTIGTLSFVTNAATSPVASLQGTADAMVAVSNVASTGTLGPLQIQASKTQTFTLSSSGNTAVVPSLVTITGVASADYILVNGCTVNMPIAVGQSCLIAVVFKPSQAGVRTATLEITTNASPTPQTVTLSGEGSAVPVANAPTIAAIEQPGKQSGAGGGCTTGDAHRGFFDPTLWLLLLASALILTRRKQSR